MATLAVNALVHGLPGGPAAVLGPIVFVGVLANIAYTLGSVTEITAEKIWGRKVLPVGPVLFRQGVLFSVGLTFVLPMIILTVGAVAKILGAIF